MKVQVACPKCGQKYAVSDRLLGRKFVCANQGCGTSFNANVARPVSDPSVSTLVEDEPPEPEETAPDEKSPFNFEPPPISMLAARSTSETQNKITDTACRFNSLGRVLVYCGLVILIAGAAFPFKVNQSAELGAVVNMPLAMVKLSVLLIGTTITIAGAAIWSGSSVGPSILDVEVLGVLTILLALAAIAFTVYSWL